MNGDFDFAADSPLVADLHPSPNIEPRRDGAPIDILLMHYTGFIDVERAIDWLARPESRVSCHYVVSEDGVITQMVPEHVRAWHAGESCWHGVRDINSQSIGIEIQNPGHERDYHDFPERQMQAVLALSKDIIARHTIPPERVLAHSDIAPHRKIDPGEKFDWAWLASQGVGHWVAPAPLTTLDPNAGPSTEVLRAIQEKLVAYGYECPVSGVLDPRTQVVIAAFQRHFRPARVDGVPDASCLETIEALLSALPGNRQT